VNPISHEKALFRHNASAQVDEERLATRLAALGALAEQSPVNLYLFFACASSASL
jgi:hypothetical protein